MSKITKPKLTRDDGIKYERYLYAKLMTMTTMFTDLAEELLRLRAMDMLESYQEDGAIDGEILLKMVEDVMMVNELSQADNELMEELEERVWREK